jgi:hypothetical protein
VNPGLPFFVKGDGVFDGLTSDNCLVITIIVFVVKK